MEILINVFNLKELCKMFSVIVRYSDSESGDSIINFIFNRKQSIYIVSEDKVFK